MVSETQTSRFCALVCVYCLLYNSQIKSNTQQSFSVKFKVKTDIIACREILRQRNKIEYTQQCLHIFENKPCIVLRL